MFASYGNGMHCVHWKPPHLKSPMNLYLPEELLCNISRFLLVDDLFRFSTINKRVYDALHAVCIRRYRSEIQLPIEELVDTFNHRLVQYPIEYKTNSLLFHEVLDTVLYNYDTFLLKEPALANAMLFPKACHHYHQLMFECSLTREEAKQIEQTRIHMKPFFFIKKEWESSFPDFLLTRCVWP